MMLWLTSDSKYAHLTNNAKCNLSLNMKKGVCTTWNAQKFIPFQMSMQSFLYESLNTTLIQAIQCKYLPKSICEMQVKMQLYNYFVFSI